MIKNIIKKILFLFSFIGKKDCLLIGTPTHHNLGDSEIVIAEKKFLKDNNFTFFEVTVSEYLSFRKYLLNGKNKFKIILLHGGGNFGDEYKKEEEIRRNIIQDFSDKSIIMFPQTIYFTNTKNGIKELEKSKQIYNRHFDLTIFVREQFSYEFAKEHFNNVYLVPDIVLYLRKNHKKEKITNNILFLLRDDEEKSINSEKINELILELKNNNIELKVSDMMYKSNIPKQIRNFILNKKHSEISNYNLVITDRLHGMVFTYLNSRKCIALSNYNYKVKGTYEWIKNDKNIVYLDDVNDINFDLIKKLIDKNINQINYVDINKYDILSCIIRRKINEYSSIIK